MRSFAKMFAWGQIEMPDEVAKIGICRDDVVTLPNRWHHRQHEVTAI
jgi:hypothetical protein